MRLHVIGDVSNLDLAEGGQAIEIGVPRDQHHETDANRFTFADRGLFPIQMQPRRCFIEMELDLTQDALGLIHALGSRVDRGLDATLGRIGSGDFDRSKATLDLQGTPIRQGMGEDFGPLGLLAAHRENRLNVAVDNDATRHAEGQAHCHDQAVS